MTADSDPLGEPLRSLFSQLEHAGELAAVPNRSLQSRVLRGRAGRRALGTQVHFGLQLAGLRIERARYRTYGCPYTLATCEWLARRLEGAQLPELSAAGLAHCIGAPADWAAQLGIAPERLGRLLVIEDALQAAVEAPVGL